MLAKHFRPQFEALRVHRQFIPFRAGLPAPRLLFPILEPSALASDLAARPNRHRARGTLGRRVRQRTSFQLGFLSFRLGSEGTPTRRGRTTMLGQNFADAVDLYSLEHHFPLGWVISGLIGAGNIAATVATLLAA